MKEHCGISGAKKKKNMDFHSSQIWVICLLFSFSFFSLPLAGHIYSTSFPCIIFNLLIFISLEYFRVSTLLFEIAQRQRTHSSFHFFSTSLPLFVLFSISYQPFIDLMFCVMSCKCASHIHLSAFSDS